MRLTVDLVEGAAQYIHPATKDRELDLRGYKIPVIENMGATRDQFDSIDFSDNEIKKLENFPLLKRLKKLLLNNNRICKIQDRICESLPNLSWLILTNNDIKELGDLDGLTGLTQLHCLSLLNNPVATKKHYRLYVIHKLPTVRLLDFRRVRLHEREEAAKLFKGKKGKALAEEIAPKSNEFVPGEDQNGAPAKQKRSAAEIEAIKAAIAKATTIEEVERLKQQLHSGFVPEHNSNSMSQQQPSNDEQMEH